MRTNKRNVLRVKEWVVLSDWKLRFMAGLRKMDACTLTVWMCLRLLCRKCQHFRYIEYKRGSFLGASSKFLKATIRFVMSIRPHGTTLLPLEWFSWNLIFLYLSKNLSRKFKFVTETDFHFLSYLAQIFLESEMFQTEVVEKIKTGVFMFHKFSIENHAFYETVRKHTVEPGSPQMTVRRMRIACCIVCVYII